VRRVLQAGDDAALGAGVAVTLNTPGAVAQTVVLGKATTLAVDGGTLDVSGTLTIGGSVAATGTLTVTHAGAVTAGQMLNLDAGTYLVTLDASSSIVVGAAPAVAGAVALGSGGSIEGGFGVIAGNIADNGMIELTGSITDPHNGTASRGFMQVGGSLRGSGTVRLDLNFDYSRGYTRTSSAWSEVLDASGFTGNFVLQEGSVLVLDGGQAPKATISVQPAVAVNGFTGGSDTAYVVLGNLPYLISQTGLNYNPVSGLLTVLGDTLNVGLGHVASDFTLEGGPGVSPSGYYTSNLIVAISGGIVPAAPAATWLGGSSALWSDAANWQDSALPQVDGAVVISGGHTVTVDPPGSNAGFITLDAGSTLTVAATLSLGGVFSGGRLDITGKLAGNRLDLAPDTLIVAGTIVDSGSLELGAGTIAISGSITRPQVLNVDATVTDFVNSGSIGASAITFKSTVAPGSYANTGTINADTITFASAVTTSLGKVTAQQIMLGGYATPAFLTGVHGTVNLGTTFDLGGGTLDAGAYGGTLYLWGATLDNVVLMPSSKVSAFLVTLVDAPPASSFTLDSSTVDLAYHAGARLGGIPITAAGYSYINDQITALGGTVTLGADVSITQTSGDLSLAGPGVFEIDGTINVQAGTLDVATLLTGSYDLIFAAAAMLSVTGTLGGAGTITLAGGASLDIGHVDGSAMVTIDLTGGPHKIGVGGNGGGVMLQGLQAGDVLDLTALGSYGSLTPSAVLDNGTLNVTSAAGATASLVLDGSLTGMTFFAASDGTGGTQVLVDPSTALTAATDFNRDAWADYGSVTLDGGTLVDGDLVVEGNYTVDLLAGAVWQTGSLSLGPPYQGDPHSRTYYSAGGNLAVVGGVLAASQIAVGWPDDYDGSGAGTLAALGGASITAGGLSLGFATMAVDATSSVLIGTGTATPGAVTVAAGATLNAVSAAITGNLIDGGLPYVSPVFGHGAVPTTLSVSGDVTVTGSLETGGHGEISAGGGLAVLDGGQIYDYGGQSGGLQINGALLLGPDSSAGPDSNGTLTISSDWVPAGGLSLFGGSLVTLDPYSSLILGTGTGINGAVVAASGSTLTADFGTVAADLAGAGALALRPLPLPGTGSTQGVLTITGNVSLSSSIDIPALTKLAVGGQLSGGSAKVEAGGALTAGTLAENIALNGTASFSAVSGAPTITFGSGAAMLSLGQYGALALTLDGLQDGDRIDFTAVAPNGTAVESGGSLVLAGVSVALTNPQTGLHFAVAPDGHGGAMVTASAPCFVAGTRILTEHGPIAVEDVRPGDNVRTASGRLAPVVWTGSTRIGLARHRQPWRAAPVRVAAGAIGPGVPARDLFLSPDHALFVDGALVPVWQLANGSSIAHCDGWPQVRYVHIELDRHGIVLAEDCPCESYLDTRNRGLLDAAGGPRPLYPDLDAPPGLAALRIWAERGAAPLLLGQQATAPLRQRLLDRAAALGARHTDDPALTVRVRGAVVATSRVAAQVWQAQLPANTATLRLPSRSFVPAEMHPGSGDTRRLGIAVSTVLIGGWPLAGDAFTDGWHAPDHTGWRWSNGDAGLRLPQGVRVPKLEIRIAVAAQYWDDSARPQPMLSAAAGPRSWR